MSDCVYEPDLFGKSAVKISYTRSGDPVNVFSKKIEEAQIESGMNSLMLRKRTPEYGMLQFPKSQDPKKSLKLLKLGMTVEDSIAALSKAKLERYKQILEWKKEKGIEDQYSHVDLDEDKVEVKKSKKENGEPSLKEVS